MPTTPPCDHRALFFQIAKGDKIAYKVIFDHYKAPFHSAAYKLTRSAYLAEEIVQEVFILLWTRRAQVAVADNPTSYLFTILYNSIYAHFRKLAADQRLQQVLFQHLPEWEAPVTETLLQEKEDQLLLNTVIGKLPQQQQLVYKLSRQQGMSRGEIANQMQISPHSVKNHLQHAVRSIRLYFKDKQAISTVLLFLGFLGC